MDCNFKVPRISPGPSNQAASDEDGQKDVENSAKKQKIEENPVIENMDSFDDVEFSFCLDDGKINPDDFVKSMCEKEFHSESNMNHLLEDTFFPLEPNRETFFGLPMRVKDLLREIKGIDELYDWQIECLKLPAIEMRQNLIYTLPTSSGKTLVAEILILKELICHQRNVLFILPYVAVVKEKISSLAPFAVALDFLVEEYAGRNGECPPRKRRKKRSVYIATIEKSLSVINSLIEAGRLEEIGLVVIDELHLIGEKGRGASLETAITKIKFKGLNIQFVGMSATIGNIMEIEQFMEATTFAGNFRPVKLTEYIKCENDIYEVNPSNSEMFVPYRVIESDYDEKKLQIDPDHLGQLVMEVSPQDGVLIFCPTRQNCENVARLLANVLSEDFLQHRKAEKMSLLENMMKFFEYVCPILRKTIPYGIAYHHSGLVAEERRFLEEAFLDGTLCVICCTSTLAVGVNLPAKRVILRSPYIGREFITKSRYKQMVGRAGRVGMGTAYGDSIIILRSRDKPLAHDLFHSPMDTAKTSMHLCEFRGLSNLILSAISLGMATTYRQLVKLASMTLLAVQAEELSVVLRTEVEGIVKKFYKMNALWIKQESVPLDCTIKILTTQSSQVRNSPSMKKQIVIKSNSELEISNVGKAAVAACIDLDEAEKLYGELKKVQLGLVLVDYLHLLYIVTPTDVDLKMDPMILCDEYLKLSPDQLHTAHTLGINEGLIMGIRCGKKFSQEKMRIVNRFYVTLIIQALWNLEETYRVALRFKVNRGLVQSLMGQTASNAGCITRFCEHMSEFWALASILSVVVEKLRHCCSPELIPLMELPSVQLVRAKQLYAAGFKTIELIAQAKPKDLVQNIYHMSFKTAREIISAATLYNLLESNAVGEVRQFTTRFGWS
ncbi:helicase POLQ-like isoform X2 [Phlebotomus papatasi]|uniref:helicase POLQ-like isoform X2 n=1 Tax=Phlebotomus papatasi TaxID=29031 RepID=UPI0024842B30|nr:helicase POLQ-like isoform X2 [Phlebotomus papatasi]